jgi:hypothetical protein
METVNREMITNSLYQGPSTDEPTHFGPEHDIYPQNVDNTAYTQTLLQRLES